MRYLGLIIFGVLTILVPVLLSLFLTADLHFSSYLMFECFETLFLVASMGPFGILTAVFIVRAARFW